MTQKTSDHVDFILGQWGKEHPELNFTSTGIFGRIHRLSGYLMDINHKVFQSHGMIQPDFDVLATLYRSGKPYEKSPGDLLSTLLITSGTMTNRVDRLVKLGFVERLPDPEDGRGVLIRMTEKGLKALQPAIKDHLRIQEEVLSVLSKNERETLSSLLRILLITQER